MDIPVNHHAGQSHFAGPVGLVVGLIMLVAGRARARLVVDLAGVSESDRAVDIGCGPGNAVRAAARRRAQVTGVDPATAMLRLARAMTRDQAGVTWVHGSAENLPLPDGSATVAWSVASVHHWTDVAAGLAEVRRVLVTGGRFLAIERRVRPGATGLASHGWTDQQATTFADCCRSAGFDGVQVETTTLGRHVAQVVSGQR
ncbi:class I SAM-dependent methyltransferase [Mycobacterium sp.]|uniref:class I SAM-dependent methyltransferase n=1 Tax=Mycobacterium sp. TaxID=1785 RepID=UPI001270CFBE|nr:class I SAM-dependent methyltransferase [Mycobacterium sp.]KAA8958232.1 MAG: class I SAM-dependent methyltransferase [Mycobacterium sp.]